MATPGPLAAWLLIVAGLLVATAAPVPPGPTIAAVLKQNGYNQFMSLIKLAGAEKGANNPKSRYTVLAPTDAAITAFLKEMGLTMDDLAKRPQLVADILSYHLIPTVKKGTADVKKPLVVAVTADPVYVVRVLKNGSQITLMDTQRHTARIVQPNLDAGSSMVHGIDRVLQSGDFFTSPVAALEHYSLFSNLTTLLETAGLASSLGSNSFGDTLFAPINSAFAGLKLPTDDKGKLVPLLQYHLVSGFRPYAQGFQSGQAIETLLKGHNVTVQIRRVPASRDKATGQVVEYLYPGTVLSEAGKPARIGIPNIWTGKGVIHGIDQVLLPKLPAPTTAVEAGPKVGAAAGGAAAGSSSGTHGRKLMRGGGFRGGGGGFGGGFHGDDFGAGRAFDAYPNDRDLGGAAAGYAAGVATGAAADGWGSANNWDAGYGDPAGSDCCWNCDESDYDC